MRKLALAALALIPTAAFGCTALLGDFEVNATNTTPEGGGGDGPSNADGDTDGGGSTDADPDAFDAQSLVFTTCGINESSIRTIQEVPDAGPGGVGWYGQVQIFRINQTTVRVIAQRNIQSGGVAGPQDGATIYTFDPKNGSGPLNPTILDLQGAGRYYDARRLGNQGILALLFMERDPAAPVVRMKVYELPDGNPSGQSSIKVSADFPTPTGGSGSGALGAYANNNEYFWALGGVPSAVGPTFDLMVGHRVSASSLPTPVVIHSDADERMVRIREIARSQQTQYIFNDKGPDSAQEKGSAFYPTPQDTQAGVPPKNLQPATSSKPWVMIGASGVTTGDGLRLAVAEVDFSATNFGQVRAGLVSQADLAALDGSKVPPAFTLTSLSDVPSEGEARFFGPDMIWLGTPPEPLKGQGLNMIWYETDKRVMRAKQTGMQRMLLNHTTIDRVGMVLDTQTAVNAEADVAFIEKVNGIWTLQYGRMSCIR